MTTITDKTQRERERETDRQPTKKQQHTERRRKLNLRLGETDPLSYLPTYLTMGGKRPG